jgi:hypothetical protein
MLRVGSVKALLASGPLIIQQSHGQRLDHRLHAGRLVSSQEWLDHKCLSSPPLHAGVAARRHLCAFSSLCTYNTVRHDRSPPPPLHAGVATRWLLCPPPPLYACVATRRHLSAPPALCTYNAVRSHHYKVWACPIAALGRLAVVHSVPHRPMDRYAPHSGQLWGSHGWQALGLHSLARKQVPRVRLSP